MAATPEKIALMEQAMAGEPSPEPSAEPEAEVAVEAAPESEPQEPEEDPSEPEGEKKLSGHKRQKAKIQRLEAELARREEVIGKFYEQASAVLKDNETLIAELEQRDHEISKLRSYLEENGVTPDELVDPKEIELMRLRRELKAKEDREKTAEAAARERQKAQVITQIKDVARTHGLEWRSLAKSFAALGGSMTLEETAASMASVTGARKQAEAKVARTGQTTTLRAETRSAPKPGTREDKIAFMRSFLG